MGFSGLCVRLSAVRCMGVGLSQKSFPAHCAPHEAVLITDQQILLGRQFPSSPRASTPRMPHRPPPGSVLLRYFGGALYLPSSAPSSRCGRRRRPSEYDLLDHASHDLIRHPFMQMLYSVLPGLARIIRPADTLLVLTLFASACLRTSAVEVSHHRMGGIQTVFAKERTKAPPLLSSPGVPYACARPLATRSNRDALTFRACRNRPQNLRKLAKLIQIPNLKPA